MDVCRQLGYTSPVYAYFFLIKSRRQISGDMSAHQKTKDQEAMLKSSHYARGGHDGYMLKAICRKMFGKFGHIVSYSELKHLINTIIVNTVD